MKSRYFFYLCLFLFPYTLFSVESFSSIKVQIDNRWQIFQANRNFILFEPGRSDREIANEFEKVRRLRTAEWRKPHYQFAHHLFTSDLIRSPGNCAFAYNNTVAFYNASTMCLNGRGYIACEGPRSKDLTNFFSLLTSQNVTHLVRLTDSHEGTIEKCHPYWKGISETNPEGQTYLKIPTEINGVHFVRSYDMAYWKDNEGIDPNRLLEMVLQVRQDLVSSNGLLLAHCSAGVGRTGTFLASLAIVEAMDKDEPFSIEEIVLRLSLQRVNSVGKCCQYTTLYRLAEAYAASFNK